MAHENTRLLLSVGFCDRLMSFCVPDFAPQVEDVTIVMDRNTGRSKGYGFVTFQTMEGAFSSLHEPEKELDVCDATGLCQLRKYFE